MSKTGLLKHGRITTIQRSPLVMPVTTTEEYSTEEYSINLSNHVLPYKRFHDISKVNT